jgi:hypothetical protein
LPRASTRLESMDARLGNLETRMDVLLKIAGKHHRDLEKRVAALEQWKEEMRRAR